MDQHRAVTAVAERRRGGRRGARWSLRAISSARCSTSNSETGGLLKREHHRHGVAEVFVELRLDRLVADGGQVGHRPELVVEVLPDRLGVLGRVIEVDEDDREPLPAQRADVLDGRVLRHLLLDLAGDLLLDLDGVRPGIERLDHPAAHLDLRVLPLGHRAVGERPPDHRENQQRPGDRPLVDEILRRRHDSSVRLFRSRFTRQPEPPRRHGAGGCPWRRRGRPASGARPGRSGRRRGCPGRPRA